MIDPVSLAIQVAIIIAVNLISMALNAKNVEQGKLDDVNIDTASYGYALPRVWGCHYVTLQTVWIKDNALTERRKKKKIGPFGIGGSITTFNYSVTCFMVGGLGRAQLGRMWVNNNLAADRRMNWLDGDTRYDGPNFDGGSIIPRGETLDTKYWRWHDGAQDQMPPTSMITAEGIENCPGHRGVFGIELTDIPLEKYGNSIPTIKTEIFVNGTDDIDQYDLYGPGSVDVSAGALMFNKNYLLSTQVAPEQPFILDVVNNTILRELTIAHPVEGMHAQIGTNQFFAVGSGQVERWVIYNWMTGSIERIADEVNGSSTFSGMPASYNGITTFTTRRSVVGTAGNGRIHIVNNAVGTTKTINYIAQLLVIDPTADSSFEAKSFPITPFDVFVFWGRSVSWNEAWIVKISFNTIAWSKRATTIEGIAPDTGSYSGQFAAYNEHAGGIVCAFGESICCVLDPQTGDKLYDLPFKFYSLGDSYDQIAWAMYNQPQRMWICAIYNGVESVILYDFATREVVESHPSLAVNARMYFPTADQAVMYAASGASRSGILWFNLSEANPVTLGDIVDDLVTLADMPAGYIDTSAATKTITGFKIDRSTSIQAIQDLITILDYDLIDAGANYILRPRSEAVIVSIDPEDLGASEGDSDNSSVAYKIQTPYDYPQRIELTFADFEGDYENNMVYAFVPDDTVKSTAVGHISTGIVLTVEEAKQLVYDAFSSTYRKRVTSGFKLPIHKYARLSVGDVVQITDPESGDTQAFKLENLQGAYALEFGAARSDAIVGAIPAIVTPPRRTPEQTLIAYSPTDVLIIDANESRRDQAYNDLDNPYAMSGVARLLINYFWNGATVYKSNDNGINYTFAYSENVELPSARMISDLNLDATASVPDTLAPLTIRIHPDNPFVPQDATLTELLESETLNIAKISCNDPTNDWEVIQYGEVTDNMDGTYTFGVLLRGRFGTEDAISKHAAAGIIYFEPTSVPVPISDPLTQILSISDVGLSVKLASITSGQTSEELNETASITFYGRNVMPYAPSTLLAHPQDNTDIIVSWLRRDRYALITESIDDTVPNTEVVESYNVDVIHNNTVIRSTTVSTSTWTYTAAMQTTDGVDGDTVTFSVCQISSKVGEGRKAYVDAAA